MTTTPEPPRLVPVTDDDLVGLTAWQREHFLDAITHTAERLRQTAEDLDRIVGSVPTASALRDGDTFGRFAATAVHAVTWGVANANLDRMVRTAAAADEPLARGRQRGDFA